MPEHTDPDLAFLRAATRPSEPTGLAVNVVDLFAGCGGMSLGLWEAARRHHRRLHIPLAVEMEPEFASVFQANHPRAVVRSDRVENLFPGDLGARLDAGERKLRNEIGPVDILVGGPPCQGHSDLNNRTRRSDPRNQLYLRMARAAAVLHPTFVVIENVTAVQWDQSDVVGETREGLEKLGYRVAAMVVDLHKVGVPQRRRRHLMLATKRHDVEPDSVLASLETFGTSDRTLRWAIGDLEVTDEAAMLDRPSTMSATNRARVEFLFRKRLHELPDEERPPCHRSGGHSYKSVYGRLRWDEPAQTITTGFGSMGQGRYVHPTQKRTLTPHEAARIQTFPDWFDFGPTTLRTRLATMIGNAVPPLLMLRLGTKLVSVLDGQADTGAS